MSAARHGTLSLLAGRVGRHTTVYGATAALQLALGLASLALLTRYLDPADFGHMAVLLFFASLLTMVYNLGTLQGTFRWVFGGGDDEDGLVEGDEPAGAFDRRRGLMTGVLLTLGIGAVGSVVVVVWAAPLAELLLGERADADLIRLAAASGVAHAVWRLLINALRLELRPGAYLAGTVSMLLLVIGITWILLASGEGLEGAVAGQAVGTSAAVVVAALMGRHNLRLAASWHDARGILSRGRALIPVVISVNVIQLADVLLLSRTIPSADVGFYRVASRMGALVSYWTSSLHMAWGPLRRDPLRFAADREHGLARTSAIFATYFVVLVAWAILFCALFAHLLVRIAGDAYAPAASLLPLTAMAFAFHGFFVLAYRTSGVPSRRTWFVRFSVLAAVTFAGVSAITMPVVGAYGAPLAAVCGWSVGIVGLGVVSARAGNPTPYEYRRLGLVFAAGGLCFALSLPVREAPLAIRLAVETACLLAFPVLLVAIGAVPRKALAPLGAALRSALPSPLRGRTLRRRLERLDARERHALALVVGQRLAPREAATRMGTREDEVHRIVVTALRTLTGAWEGRDADAAVGRYLLSASSFADRARMGEQLFAEGVDPVSTDALRQEMRSLNRHRRLVRRAAVMS